MTVSLLQKKKGTNSVEADFLEVGGFGGAYLNILLNILHHTLNAEKLISCMRTCENIPWAKVRWSSKEMGVMGSAIPAGL